MNANERRCAIPCISVHQRESAVQIPGRQRSECALCQTFPVNPDPALPPSCLSWFILPNPLRKGNYVAKNVFRDRNVTRQNSLRASAPNKHFTSVALIRNSFQEWKKANSPRWPSWPSSTNAEVPTENHANAYFANSNCWRSWRSWRTSKTTRSRHDARQIRERLKRRS
jgi:hypothetical protein